MLVKSSMTGDYFINSSLEIVKVPRKCEDVSGYYELLGVTPYATQEEIKKAAKKKILANHPDVGGSNEVFLQIVEAYKVLSNLKERALYDAKSNSEHYIKVKIREVEIKPPCFYKEAKDIVTEQDIKIIRKWQSILLQVAQSFRAKIEIKVGITSREEQVQELEDVFVINRNDEPEEYMAKVFVLRSLTWQTQT